MSPLQKMAEILEIVRGLWKRSLGRLSLLPLFLLTALAVRSAVPESDVKAAFLYNSAKFVEWPKEAFASDSAPIQVGVVSDDDFTAKLRALLSDKKAHGRSFEVKKISSPQDAKNLHMLFIPGAENRRLPQFLEATKKSPTLTLGESDQFLDTGGMINILFEDSNLRFEVYPEPAERVNLVISSKFLRLAKRVKKGAKNE
jgi:hypothetical protein